jgi:subtilisin-like proprotein convertase family protein
MRSPFLGCVVVALATLTAYAQDFSNPDPISIPSVGTATPYPSPITVGGIGDQLVDVTVTLTGISHTYPDDIDILLVGPSGASVILMSDAGGGGDLVDVTLTFSDAASGTLPDSTQIVSGTYLPTNYVTGDAFAAPAPPGPYGSTFAGFIGTNPNGEWRLFVVDDASSDLGQIAGGWTLHLTAIAGGPAACCFLSGDCQMLTTTECDAAGGSFLGPGTACGPETCLGACCMPDGACVDYIPQMACSDGGGLFRGYGSECATAACPPYGDQCFNAILIPELPFSDTGNTCDFNNDYDSGVVPPACPFSGSTAKDVVYRIDSFFDVFVEISLCNDGTNYDTKLYVYEDECVNPPIACADDVCNSPQFPSNYISRLDSVELLAGHTYYIVVDGYSTSCGPYTLTVEPLGACCSMSGACQLTTRANCIQGYGYWQGPFTSCDPNPCTPFNYYLAVDEAGLPIAQAGDGYPYEPSGEFYYYPQTVWYNMWWPNEFDLNRQKIVNLDFLLDFPSGSGYAEIAINYGTDAWTAQGFDRPPLPADVPTLELEDLYIGRLPLGVFQETGHYTTDRGGIVLPYCPSWISVDIRGYGFVIVGDIVHICPPAARGACCVGPACSMETPDGCAAIGGAYMGDGTDCFPNPCIPPPEYWLQLTAGGLVEQGGSGFEGQWFYYPDTLWYNMWWPNEFDLTRQKLFTLEFDLDFPAGAIPPTIAFTYSTRDWDDPTAPPLPPLDQYIVRQPVDPPPTAPGHYVYTTVLPYCPAWVSIDVQADDVAIQGTIEHTCLPTGGACCVGWDCSIQPDGDTCVNQLHGRYMGDGTTCDPNPCPITDVVVCEPQGDGNPVHPPTYWYDVTPGDFGRCDFHVRVYDPDPANYAVGPMPPTWQFLVHTLPNGETWASWWDADCSDAIYATFRFQFTHYGPSDWGDWTTTIGANNDPYDQQIDASWHHPDLPDGYGYRVHVPLPPPTGACCVGLTCMPDLTQSQCESQGGIWQGAGSDCFPNPCLPVPADYWLRLVGGEPVEQGGTGFDGMWFFYPDEAWWNMWWPNEFDLMRQKQVTLDFFLDYPPLGTPPFVALNFSTSDWPDPTAPPLPPLDAFITRLIFEPPIEPGHHVYTMTLPYCPMWVSVDVRGEGTIVHECLPRPCLNPADSNCDGLVNAFDIDPFVIALTAGDRWLATYPCDYMCANDINCDGYVNAFDIDPFVGCLTGTINCQPCP